MNKRIKVRSSFDNTVKSLSLADGITITAESMINDLEQRKSPTLGGVSIGQGPTFTGTPTGLTTFYEYSVSAAPVIHKEYVEREVYDGLAAKHDALQSEVWCMGARLSVLENEVKYGMVSTYEYRVQKLEMDMNTQNLPFLQQQIYDLGRKLDWGTDSVMKQLQEVRGAEYRYIY